LRLTRAPCASCRQSVAWRCVVLATAGCCTQVGRRSNGALSVTELDRAREENIRLRRLQGELLVRIAELESEVERVRLLLQNAISAEAAVPHWLREH